MPIVRLQDNVKGSNGVYYEIDDQNPPVGQGGMGVVFCGTQIDANGQRRSAAIKFLYEDLPDFVIQRAIQEASIQLHNDNLVEMFDFMQIKEVSPNGGIIIRNHVTSEFLTGVMLFDLLRGVTTDRNGNEIPFANELFQQYSCDREAFALFIIKSVLSGIMALHDAGYVHRDIDPSNIMITNDGKVKIIDFGVVKNMRISANVTGHALSTIGQVIGKPAYAAPEVAYGLVDEHDYRTDIYAIGVMLFELITGHLPFRGDQAEVLEMQKTKPLPTEEISNNSIAYIIQKATAKKKEARYQTASEFRVDVEKLLRGEQISQESNHTASVMLEENVKPLKKNAVNNSTNTIMWIVSIVAGLAVGSLLAIFL